MNNYLLIVLFSAVCAACGTSPANQQNQIELEQIKHQTEKQQEERAKKGNPNSSNGLTSRVKFDLEDGLDFAVQLWLKR